MFYLGWNNDYKLKPDDVILWYSILEIKIKEWYKYKTIKCENEKRTLQQLISRLERNIGGVFTVKEKKISRNLNKLRNHSAP